MDVLIFGRALTTLGDAGLSLPRGFDLLSALTSASEWPSYVASVGSVLG